jgi:hypothetical protein
VVRPVRPGQPAAEITQALYQARHGLEQPAVRKRLENDGAQPSAMPPERSRIS